MTEYEKIVVTLKPNGEPWVVVRGDNANEIKNILNELGQGGVYGEIVVNNFELAAAYNANKELGATPTQVQVPANVVPIVQPTTPAQPVSAPQAQAAPGPVCKHGPMQFRSGTGKNGKPWSAHMCPSPKGTPDACEPQWIR